jgi:acyl-coenzyme A thioesterase PaaI-like protein
MYFGALASGADAAAGLLAMWIARQEGRGITLLFKDFKADFLKRAESDVLFVCEDGVGIRKLVIAAADGTERVHRTVPVQAVLASDPDGDPVANFELTMSLRGRKRRA